MFEAPYLTPFSIYSQLIHTTKLLAKFPKIGTEQSKEKNMSIWELIFHKSTFKGMDYVLLTYFSS